MTFRINVDSYQKKQIYWNNFKSSNAVVCLHLIIAYTGRLAIIHAAELERNGCFSLPLLRNVVLWWKRISAKSFQIELVTKYDTSMIETFCRGVQICEGRSISASGFGPGGSISASGFRPGGSISACGFGPGVQIRGGSKSAVTPAVLSNSWYADISRSNALFNAISPFKMVL